MNTTSNPAGSIATTTDSTKLVSLLALATSAVALPQTGNADIIYTDMTTSPVVVGYAGVDSFLFSLPGTAVFGFQRQEFETYTQPYSVFTINYRTVLAGDRGGASPSGVRGVAGGFASPQGFNASWSQGGVGTFYNVAVGTASSGGRTPLNGYDHLYLAWTFRDSTQDAFRYGWVEVSLSIGNITANPGSGPNVTIWGYAYDNTGAKPTMGQLPVPEPSSGALLAVGALMLGSRGVRKWRHNRETVSQS